MSRFIKIIALASALASIAAQATPTPVLSQSNISQSSWNVGSVTLAQSSSLSVRDDYMFTGNTTTTVINRSEVKPYVIENYRDTTTTTNWTEITYYVDSFTNILAGGGGGIGGAKLMQLSGTVHSTQDINLDFSLNASGNFRTINIAGIGSINPAFPTLLIGFDGAEKSAVTTYTNSTNGGNYSVRGNSRQWIGAGDSLSFSALVFAGSEVSLDNFYVTFSGNHDFSTNRRSQTTTSTAFVSTSPVPEPENYAMLMAGLGMIGFMSRRQKANLKA